MDGSSYFPTRPQMEQGIAAFVERTGVAVRFNCSWESTERDRDTYVVSTSDGTYYSDNLVIATGMTRPYRPAIPGLEVVPHYAEVKPLEAYRDRRVLIIGKRNSGFELADGLLPHARQIVLASPSPASFALDTHTIAGVRARYVQPFEDHLLRGGVLVLDASIEALERGDDRFRARLRLSPGGDELSLEFDEVIAATGFQSCIGDLPALGARIHGHLQVPAQTPFWESVTLPGLFFAGTLSQGARGLRKHGIPSASASVHGFRYNARILAQHLAEKRLGMMLPRLRLRPREVVPYLLSELTHAPELWLQRSYLTRVLTIADDAIVNDGIRPLHDFVDASGADAVAVTIELNAAGDTYPAVYVRRAGALSEHVLSGSTLQDFETPGHARELTDLIRPVFSSVAIPV
jgi:thioredoxin reductase